MKTIGLLGGVSWHSTVDYYKYINTMVNQRLGGNNAAKCIIYSINFNDVYNAAYRNDFETISALVTDACLKLELSGADCIGLSANTIHRFAADVIKKVNIPLIHIAEETAKVVRKQNITKAGLIGTKLTMEDEFYCNKLSKGGIEVIIPNDIDRQYIHDKILGELTQGVFNNDTKKTLLAIIEKLNKQGAEGIILGCTEIPLLISQADCTIPVFDTTYIHSEALVEFALG
ncbi:MAG: hypothetical protein A2033_04790 [Bacteroidetes bacterium GWA2_31_9]|nr:MAG: hypothetical protein A2033_04790 [Bacteroidetes bacterium GWA2_31_9]